MRLLKYSQYVESANRRWSLKGTLNGGQRMGFRRLRWMGIGMGSGCKNSVVTRYRGDIGSKCGHC
jgi:hypothetical protein